MTADNRVYNDFLNSLLKGDRLHCYKIIQDELMHHASIFDLYENILKKSLYEIGVLWESNQISTATEHLASAIVEAILNQIYPTIASRSQQEKSVVLACVENEMHQIGIKMVSDVFEMNGWKTFFLGVNTPVEALITFTQDVKPTLLAISMSLYFHLPDLEKMILQIRHDIPELPIYVGGQAFQQGSYEVIAKYENVRYLPDLQTLDNLLKKNRII